MATIHPDDYLTHEEYLKTLEPGLAQDDVSEAVNELVQDNHIHQMAVRYLDESEVKPNVRKSLAGRLALSRACKALVNDHGVLDADMNTKYELDVTLLHYGQYRKYMAAPHLYLWATDGGCFYSHRTVPFRSDLAVGDTVKIRVWFTRCHRFAGHDDMLASGRLTEVEDE